MLSNYRNIFCRLLEFGSHFFLALLFCFFLLSLFVVPFAAKSTFSKASIAAFKTYSNNEKQNRMHVLASPFNRYFHRGVQKRVADYMRSQSVSGRVANYVGVVSTLRKTVVNDRKKAFRKHFLSSFSNPVTRFFDKQRLNRSVDIQSTVEALGDWINSGKKYMLESVEWFASTAPNAMLTRANDSETSVDDPDYEAGTGLQEAISRDPKVFNDDVNWGRSVQSLSVAAYVPKWIEKVEWLSLFHVKSIPMTAYDLDLKLDDGQFVNYIEGKSTFQSYIEKNDLRISEQNGFVEWHYQLAFDQMRFLYRTYRLQVYGSLFYMTVAADESVSFYGLKNNWGGGMSTEHGLETAKNTLRNKLTLTGSRYYTKLEMQALIPLEDEKQNTYQLNYSINF